MDKTVPVLKWGETDTLRDSPMLWGPFGEAQIYRMNLAHLGEGEKRRGRRTNQRIFRGAFSLTVV